ncbi:MAG TPA: FAD-dependent monooxygenase, partial [Candidatus Binataceae bacterium]|nr:FAD-dependent monooxygenase [Candidatus Binataceae bacterium]
MQTTGEIVAPVLVIGGGPVGLLGAQLLGCRKIRTLVAEKHASRLDDPKAHALNPRSLEICNAAGLPMDQIHAASTPRGEGGFVRMVTTLAGREIGVLPYERQDDAVRELTPWPLINIQQPKFEAILEQAASRLPEVKIRRELEWVNCEQTQDSILSTLVDRKTGGNVTVRSRYLVAADGARSTVRDAIGIGMDGPADVAENLMIHFEADLRQVVGARPAILYFLFGPGPGGVLIAYDISRTWVFMYPYRPDQTPRESFDQAVCRKLVLAAIGAPVDGVRIKSVRPWSMSAQVASHYREGAVFLAGDAAHRFPPTGGLGLNTGIADIDNLAWKIAAVLNGWATPGILDSYESERREIAQTNMLQSLSNAQRMLKLGEALGQGAGQSVDSATFEARISDPASRAKVDAAVAAQREHFDSLRLQLGYVYGGSQKGDADVSISAFEPKAIAGARLPHVALRGGRSVLDLVNLDGLTLISG